MKRKRKFTPGDFALKVRRGLSGLGLYTLSPIKKGECVIEYKGRQVTPEEEERMNGRYIFEVNGKKRIDGSGRDNTARYINHSCRPNCEIEIYWERIWVMAKRNIKAGEELSYDYDAEYFEEWIKPYGCRCEKCRTVKKSSRKAA